MKNIPLAIRCLLLFIGVTLITLCLLPPKTQDEAIKSKDTEVFVPEEKPKIAIEKNPEPKVFVPEPKIAIEKNPEPKLVPPKIKDVGTATILFINNSNTAVIAVVNGEFYKIPAAKETKIAIPAGKFIFQVLGLNATSEEFAAEGEVRYWFAHKPR